jgi:hypothetical protein
MQSRARRRVRLNQFAITSPCSLPWETMPGDDRVRFCGQCKQNVYNISGMTEREATRLIADRQGRLCGRITRRADGTIVTADCWTRLRAARRRGLLHLAAVMLLVIVPELLSMRFGLGNLLRLVGLGPAEPPAMPFVQLPPAPQSFHRVSGGEFPEPADPARVVEQLMTDSLGNVGYWPPPKR